MNSTDGKRSMPHRKSLYFTTVAEHDTLSTLAIRKSENSWNILNFYKATENFATPSLTSNTTHIHSKYLILPAIR